MIFIKPIVADLKGISKDLSHHPVHLIPDSEGNLPPSALVPFCSYQEDYSFLGQANPELGNMTVCDKFKPTYLEGQPCYSLDAAKYSKKDTKAGKNKGLFLLVDSNPYQLRSENEAIDRESFRVYIHTLAPHTAYGRGSYGMHTLKRMTGTTNFQELPDKQKKCRIHNREECQTKMLLSLLKANCSCVPWLLVTDNKKVFQELSFHPTSRSCM